MKPSHICFKSVGSSRPSSTSFIGLGRMGHHMAFNLFSKKHALSPESRFIVYDVMHDKAKEFTDLFLSQFPKAHIRAVASPEETIWESQTLLTMLPSSKQVEETYNCGIIPTLKAMPNAAARATLCIDSTTLDVSVARHVANNIGEVGATMIDAPVSGGVLGARVATLSFLVGGPPSGLQLAQPYLELMGKRIIYCGPSGAGLGAKICNNLILGTQQFIVGEAMLLGKKLGLDPALLASVINNSTGACWASSVNNPVAAALPGKDTPAKHGYEGGFAGQLMLKDLGLATTLAKQLSSPLALGEATERIYKHALDQTPQYAQKDFSGLYAFLDDSAQAGRGIKFGKLVVEDSEGASEGSLQGEKSERKT